MTIAEIRKIEENRDGQMNVVHLIKEGTFYHAYDWSAWLLMAYPIGEARGNPMKVTAKRLKDGSISVMVGFPLTSLSKYIPNGEIVGFKPVSDDVVDVTLNVDFAETPEEDIRARVDEWMQNLPITISKKHKREDLEVTHDAPRVRRVSDVISYVVSLEMDEISPNEAHRILRQLRRQISELF